MLCFWTEDTAARRVLHCAAGPEAIAAYLEDPLDSRLIMSMKTYLAQKSFTETRIFGHPFTLERLIGRFLRALLADIPPAHRIIVGRPVRFAGEFVDDALGADRLRGAYAEAGLPDVTLALEPEAAGTRFARTLTEPATVLIGDFGGGTSDFSVMRFDPGSGSTPLGHAGIGIAGDVFDYRIIDRAIAPLLGKGDTYRIMGKPLPVPPEYYSGFARWHLLSLMRTPRTLRAIAEVARTAQHPRAPAPPDHADRGRPRLCALSGRLHRQGRAVAGRGHRCCGSDTRTSPSNATSPAAEFEAWIAPDLARLAGTVDQVLANAGLPADRDGSRVPHRRHRLRPRRPPPVRRSLRRGEARRGRRIRLGRRGPCADRPARLVSRPHLDHQETPMATERTLSIIKPDATRRNLTGSINATLEAAGLRIVAQKRIRLTQAQAEAFYAVHKERPFFRGLVAFMISGPVVVQVLEGDNAVARNREVMGATDPKKAAPGTIRAQFAEDIEANSVHGSDSAENAAAEIAFFFAQVEIVG